MSDLYVVFSVASADYIVPSGDVIQLESFDGATPVPGAPAFVAGVVQVRGNVVPAVDLRARFGLPATERTLDTRVVIVKSGDRHVALIADRAREVVRIESDRVKPPPPIVAEQAAGFVRAVAQAGQRLFMVLDFEKVIGEESHAR